MTALPHPVSGDVAGESTRAVPVQRVGNPPRAGATDLVAVEEPMEVRIGFGPEAGRLQRNATVTMRTPGHDFELAVGFLFAEGIVSRRDDVAAVEFCGPPAPGRATSNVVRVELSPELDIELDVLRRNFVSTSSCGVCGKTSLDALALDGFTPLAGGAPVDAALLLELPNRLRTAQPIFSGTGGLHAAALFDRAGELLACREDVGRHNAVDKVIGARFGAGALPAHDTILVVSGRSSFEVVQKALRAEVPILVAVGAPSSLAVDLAGRFGMTLIGFARDGRFNVYAGGDRVRGLSDTK